METLSQEKEKELLSFVLDRFKELTDKKYELDKRVVDWLGDYHSIPRGNKQAWESDIFVPFAFSQIATIKPRLKRSLFQEKDFITVEAKHPDFVHCEQGIRDYIISEMEEINFKHVVSDAIHDAMPYGTAWFKVVLSPLENNISFSHLDFFNVITDVGQRGERSNDFTDVFHRVETNLSNIRIKEEQGVYKNTDKVGETEFPMDDILENQIKVQGYSMSVPDLTIDKPSEKKSNKLNKVELLEYWGWFDINDDGKDEPIVMTIANRSVMLRVDINPDGIIPIFPLRIYRIPHIVYGKSFIQLIEGLQAELNTKRNQFIDLLNLILKPWFKARRHGDIDWDNLFGTPNNVIRMDDPLSDLVPFEPKTPPSYMFNTEGLIKNDMQYTLGATDYNMGVSSGRGYTETATGISIITSESATRFADYLDDINFDLMTVIEYIVYLIKNYRKNFRKIRAFNTQEWTEVTQKDIEADYKLRINLAPFVQNKELRMQVLMNLANTIGQLVDIKPLIRNILELAEVKYIDEILGNKLEEIKNKKVNIAKERSTKEDIGVDRPINAITQGAGYSPLSPQAPQTVKNPVMELIKNMGGSV